MPLGLPPLRIGLAASALHRAAPNGALFRLLGPLERSIREELRAELFVLGQTYDALAADGVLADYPRLIRLPMRREGGVIHLVAAVVSGDPARRLDAVIYLLDPDDPTSVFPEGQALKRECVIHETLFVSTLAHAREWFELGARRLRLHAQSAARHAFRLRIADDCADRARFVQGRAD